MNTVFIVQGLLSIFILLLVYYSSEFIVTFLDLDAELAERASKLVQLGGVLLFFNTMASTVAAAMKGFEQYEAVSKILIASNIVGNIIGVLLVINGFGIIGLIFSELVIAILMSLLNISLVRNFIPVYSFKVSVKFELLRELVRYSWHISLVRIATQFFNRVPSIFIAILVNVEAVTYYVLATKIVNAVKMLINSAGEVLMPRFSNMASQKQNSEEEITQLYNKVSVFFSVMAASIYFYMGAFSEEILVIWVGSEVADKSWLILLLLAISTYLSTLSVVPSNVSLGLGYSKLNAKFAYFVLAIAIVCIYPMIEVFGVIGAPLALLVSQLNVLLFNVKVSRILKLNTSVYFRDAIIRPLILVLPFVLLLSLIKYEVDISSVFVFMFISFLYFLGVFLLCIWLLPELRQFKSKMLLK